MMNFCYLYITNYDVFAKCFFVLICNVYFAIFIISSLKNIISFIICNVLFTKFIKNQIFAHCMYYVQFYFCTLEDTCAILLRRLYFFCTRHSRCAILFLHIYNEVCNFFNR